MYKNYRNEGRDGSTRLTTLNATKKAWRVWYRKHLVFCSSYNEPILFLNLQAWHSLNRLPTDYGPRSGFCICYILTTPIPCNKTCVSNLFIVSYVFLYFYRNSANYFFRYRLVSPCACCCFKMAFIKDCSPCACCCFKMAFIKD